MRIMRAHRRISAQRGLEIRGLNRERRKWAGNRKKLRIERYVLLTFLEKNCTSIYVRILWVLLQPLRKEEHCG